MIIYELPTVDAHLESAQHLLNLAKLEVAHSPVEDRLIDATEQLLDAVKEIRDMIAPMLQKDTVDLAEWEAGQNP
jgi:hypothetical protein